MSTYEPGTVAMVTADNRREPFRAFFDGRTWRDLVCHGFCVDRPPTVRPLVVLDLEESIGKSMLPDWLRNNVAKVEEGSVKPSSIGKDMQWLADRIEAQTKPPRIPEPGLWAVVEAGATTGWAGRRVPWLHRPDGWAPSVSGAFSRPSPWDDLIDPTLISEGVSA